MSLLTSIGQIGHLENDNKEQKIQKSFLVYLAIFMSFGGVVWGSICLFYDLTIPAMVPYGYLVISVINLIYFKSSKNFATVRFVQVFISLVLPIIFQWMLGGFSSSGSIILWSLLALIASLSFTSIETSIRWLVFFVVLGILSAVFDPVARQSKPDVLPQDSPMFAAVNVILISSIVFGLVVFFVGQHQRTKKEVEIKNKQILRFAKELKSNYLLLKKSHDALKTQKSIESNTSEMSQYEDILTRQKKMIEEFKN